MRAPRSGTRAVGRYRVLVAHDATSTCDSLVAAITHALGDVELVDVSSVEAGRASLRAGGFSVSFICLDLPPAPQGGVRLAKEALRFGAPVVLVTRSLRWLPADAGQLRQCAWVTPEATVADVTKAILAATGGRQLPGSVELASEGWGDDGDLGVAGCRGR